ncbi:hypothetical protein O6H91_14G063000 [Diphasiastrum complanatum]|uniref:Uncharacterized protein n=1 Tax=Diphasiastrum complanatum TaxID=34168 RepID=A0ACC2BQ27_DIPCM|nr:hypothetical protein O6H91_14G063000 [Diphasiastrum complanatum]
MAISILAMASASSSSSSFPVAVSSSSCRSFETCMPCGRSSASVYRISLTNKKSYQLNTHIGYEATTTLFASERVKKNPSREVVVLVGADSLLEQQEAPEDEVSKLKLESDLLKRRKKREELRRKRLVRKRHLRKKGRWPPAKVAKNKNI